MNREDEWAGPHIPTGPTPAAADAPTLSELCASGIDLTPDVADTHFTNARALGRLTEFGAPIGHAAGRLSILQNTSITIQGVFEPAHPAQPYWPETHGTAIVTYDVPINRWHRLLWQMSGYRGFRWIKPRTRPVTIKLDNLAPWTNTETPHTRP